MATEIVPGRRTMSLNSSLNQNAQQTGRYLAKEGTVAGEMEERKLKAAANCLREGVGETATCLLPGFPANHRIKLRTNNMFYGRGSRDWRYCWVLAWFRRVRAVVRRVVGDVRR